MLLLKSELVRDILCIPGHLVAGLTLIHLARTWAFPSISSLALLPPNAGLHCLKQRRSSGEGGGKAGTGRSPNNLSRPIGARVHKDW